MLLIPGFRQPVAARLESAQQARLRLLSTIGRDRSSLSSHNQNIARSADADAALLSTLLDTQLIAERTRRP